ncbi:MAG: hypothetical protein AAF236_12635 [Verrucomicrobiota bacterium]
MKNYISAVSTLFAVVLADSSLAQEPTSFYSTIGREFVAVIEDSESDPDPELDHCREICPGYDGYELVLKGFDARSWLEVRKGETESDLYEATMSAPGGTFPNIANETVEWRGVVSDGAFHPFAIIFRISAGDPNGGEAFTKLLVVLLNDGESRLLGVTDGEEEGIEARRIADESRQ